MGDHKQSRPITAPYSILPTRLWNQLLYVAKATAVMPAMKTSILPVAWYNLTLMGRIQSFILWLYLARRPPMTARSTPTMAAKPKRECHVVKCFLLFISLLKNTAKNPKTADATPNKWRIQCSWTLSWKWWKGLSNQGNLKIKSTYIPLLVSWVLSWIHCWIWQLLAVAEEQRLCSCILGAKKKGQILDWPNRNKTLLERWKWYVQPFSFQVDGFFFLLILTVSVRTPVGDYCQNLLLSTELCEKGQ